MRAVLVEPRSMVEDLLHLLDGQAVGCELRLVLIIEDKVLDVNGTHELAAGGDADTRRTWYTIR